jgi:hypothetical protein
LNTKCRVTDGKASGRCTYHSVLRANLIIRKSDEIKERTMLRQNENKPLFRGEGVGRIREAEYHEHSGQ